MKQTNIPTREWFGGDAPARGKKFAAKIKLKARFCAASCHEQRRSSAKLSARLGNLTYSNSHPKTIARRLALIIRSPKTIGPDRLANAVAARQRFGAPVVVVDFGTAVTFDVVDAKGNYVGGIIAPGLAAMTDYLHEKTALLPKIKIREVKTAIGKSTEQAMLIGAVHGYRGLVRELIARIEARVEA